MTGTYRRPLQVMGITVHSKPRILFVTCPLQVLIDNIKEFAPIIYTPTIGLVCQNYSGLYRRQHGMYFSAKDKGEMMSMIYNWPANQILVPRIETMTEQQRSDISNFGKSCQQAEDALSQGMDKLQQMVLEYVAAGQLEEQTNTPNMSTAMERLASLMSFVNQVHRKRSFCGSSFCLHEQQYVESFVA